jgi:hypothetical protein
MVNGDGNATAIRLAMTPDQHKDAVNEALTARTIALGKNHTARGAEKSDFNTLHDCTPFHCVCATPGANLEDETEFRFSFDFVWIQSFSHASACRVSGEV